MSASLAMPLRQRLAVLIGAELAVWGAIRAALQFFDWRGVEMELFRSALRVATAWLCWHLFSDLIRSGQPQLRNLQTAPMIVSLGFLFTIPFLTGNYRLPTSTAWVFALTSLIVAVKEEFLWRGVVQNLLRSRLGTIKAVLLTSLGFSLWHFGAWEHSVWMYGETFFASVIVGLVYVASGSIAVVIAIHALYDALYSLTPLVSSPLSQNFGFIPLLFALALVANDYTMQRRPPPYR